MLLNFQNLKLKQTRSLLELALINMCVEICNLF